jgi:acyl-CoA reductase-like NAD-dependent aldehyde dehydrogenase
VDGQSGVLSVLLSSILISAIFQSQDTIFMSPGDLQRVWRVAEAMVYGMVGINTGRMSSEATPFGGVKHSGIGREGSRHGLEDYLEMKYLSVGGI